MGWQRPTLLQPVKLRPLVAVNPRSRKSSERIEIKQLHRRSNAEGKTWGTTTVLLQVLERA
jgi:hypothetical protein